MTLINDLIALGLPVAEVNGEIVFSRSLDQSERAIYRALIVKYMPEPEKSQALARRKDIGKLLNDIDGSLSPEKLSIKQEYSSAVEKLSAISTAATMSNAEAMAAIKYIAKVLLITLRYLAKTQRIAE